LKPYAIRQLSKHFKCILIAMLQYWYIYVKAFYLTPFEELKNYLFWSLLQFFKGVFVLINCDINLQLIKNTLTIFPGQGCPLCLVDYPKKNIRNFKNNKIQTKLIYIFFAPFKYYVYWNINKIELIWLYYFGIGLIEKIVERTNDSWSQLTSLSSGTHQIANKNGQLVK
jgi:hypothetical protein